MEIKINYNSIESISSQIKSAIGKITNVYISDYDSIDIIDYIADTISLESVKSDEIIDIIDCFSDGYEDKEIVYRVKKKFNDFEIISVMEF